MSPTPPPTHVVRADNLIKEYGKNRVVKGVSLQVGTGEVVGLLGPNGAGKTTTFKMLVGFEPPTGGSVTFDGEDITRLPIHMRARRGISYLAQETSVFRKMSVRDNLKAILEARGVPRNEIRTRIDQLEEELGIGHLRRRIAERLSGGEKRRVEIARALTTNPRFIFLDEPFAGIDPPTVEDLQLIIGQLRERGLGVLITDHNVRETLAITDRSYIIFEGQVRVSGTVDEVANHPDVSGYITDRIRRDIEMEQREKEARLAVAKAATGPKADAGAGSAGEKRDAPK
ncbi:MAG: LPS export ABC transporter ATP-binding protein [Sumerlaeia bacterium]